LNQKQELKKSWEFTFGENEMIWKNDDGPWNSGDSWKCCLVWLRKWLSVALSVSFDEATGNHESQ